MKRELFKAAGLLAGCILLIAGCITGSDHVAYATSDIVRDATRYRIDGGLIRMESKTLGAELDPATLETTLWRIDRPAERVVVSGPVWNRRDGRVYPAAQSIVYPGDQLSVAFHLDNRRLQVSISSLKPQAVTWPSVPMSKTGTALIWPHFEGSYIPLSDTAWTDFLQSRHWNTTESQYLPLWGVERGKRLVSYLFENPFHNEIAFRDRRDLLRMDFSHAFTPNADLSRPVAFNVYLDFDVSPIEPARHFRRYLEEHRALVTLKEKMKTAPGIERLIGAPHAYLWGGRPITAVDVAADGWAPLAKAILEQAASAGPTAGGQILLALSPGRGNFEAVSRQSIPPASLREGMAHDLSRALRSAKMYSAAVWPPAGLPPELRSIAERIRGGEKTADQETARLNGFLLHASFPAYLNDPSTWGNGVSTRMIDALVRGGMKRFALTFDGGESAAIRPNIAAYAAARGYLFGPYDEYGGVHDPDAPEWETSLHDRALYETGGIIRADGTPVRGFNGVGWSVSPVAVRPYFDKRVARHFAAVPYSQYFLDGDAFGQGWDDYRPGRIVSESEDLLAQADRIRAVFKKYKVPVGSEGGSHLCADSLAAAEGVFFPVLGKRGDPDMEQNEMSRYFLGRSFPAEEPESHFLAVPLKEKYVRLHGDPRFRLPLYEAALHDSVVSTSHYSSSSLKFANIAETTALTEILYQVAPMYHFNLSYFEKMKAVIKPHVDAFEKTHAYSYRYALEDFAFLTDDRTVQKTRFGGLELTANFRETGFSFQGTAVPARSVRVVFTETGESFVYQAKALAWHPKRAENVPALIKALSEGDAPTREAAALDLSRIGPEARAGVPALIGRLADGEWRVRAAALKALANMEGAAVPAVPEIVKALADEEWQVRRPAAYALAALGIRAKGAVAELIVALDDEEWMVRKAAVWALAAIGPEARSALPALEKLLKDPEVQVRMVVEIALRKIGGR